MATQGKTGRKCRANHAPKGGCPVRPLYDDLPKSLVVAIDGTAQSGKNTVGEIVAQTIGGVLVDSDRVYRALTKACLDAGIDLDERRAIIEFCRSAALDIRVDWDGGKVKEALPFINGRFFSKDKLISVAPQAWKVGGSRYVREAVTRALQLCACHGRIVVVGHDIGGVIFPNTPFKFFLNAPAQARKQPDDRGMNSYDAVQCDRHEAKEMVLAEDALLIETGNLQPREVSGIILIEVFWGADERKVLGSQEKRDHNLVKVSKLSQ